MDRLKFQFQLLTKVLLVCLGMVAADAQGSDMSTSYKIAFDDWVFSVTVPFPPDKEFAKHRPFIPLHDDRLFESANSVVGLNLNWTYKDGLFRKVAGVLEMKVILSPARDNNVTSDEGLKQQLLADIRRELARVGNSGVNVPFQPVEVNGRTWLKFSIPVLGGVEYATGLSDKRFLEVLFSFIDNTGDTSPAWRQDAAQLMDKLVSSMKIDRAPPAE